MDICVLVCTEPVIWTPGVQSTKTEMRRVGSSSHVHKKSYLVALSFHFYTVSGLLGEFDRRRLGS